MARTRQGARRKPKAASKRKATVARKVKHARVKKDQKEQAKRAKAKRARQPKATIHPPEVREQEPSAPLEVESELELGSGQEPSDVLDALTEGEGDGTEFIPELVGSGEDEL